MTNFEHYKNEILRLAESGRFRGGIAKSKDKFYCCDDIKCRECEFYEKFEEGYGIRPCEYVYYHWLYSEYHKPLPNWEVDHKVKVKNYKTQVWENYHFKRFTEDGRVVCFSSGQTSWSNDGLECSWNFWEDGEDVDV